MHLSNFNLDTNTLCTPKINTYPYKMILHTYRNTTKLLNQAADHDICHNWSSFVV